MSKQTHPYHLARITRADQIRGEVARLIIDQGLTIKETAQRLNLNEHTADYYWQTAKNKIRHGRSLFSELS